MRRTGVPALLSALLTLGCAPDTGTGGQPAEGADLLIELDEMFFEPDGIEVPAGETLTVELRNEGGVVHDLVFEDGWESGEVTPGASAVVEIGPFEQTTVGWCSVPGHRDAGMELEVVVTDPTS